MIAKKMKIPCNRQSSSGWMLRFDIRIVLLECIREKLYLKVQPAELNDAVIEKIYGVPVQELISKVEQVTEGEYA